MHNLFFFLSASLLRKYNNTKFWVKYIRETTYGNEWSDYRVGPQRFLLRVPAGAHRTYNTSIQSEMCAFIYAVNFENKIFEAIGSRKFRSDTRKIFVFDYE